jgi:hypothetical protein
MLRNPPAPAGGRDIPGTDIPGTDITGTPSHPACRKALSNLESETVMEGRQYDPESDSLSFPDDTVVGIVDDPDGAASAVDQLISDGIPQDRIQVLCCDSGARRLDPSGERHGVLGQIQRIIQLFGDKEVAHVERQAAELQAGKFLIAAPAESDEESRRVADILKANGGHFINRYTSWTVQQLEE